jgi:hypothetical protein
MSSPPPQTRHGIAPEFLDAADRFVEIANELGEHNARDWVRAAMMYAAARYTAFVWIHREDREQTVDDAASYYASQFDKMWRDNVAELTPLYEAAARQAGGAAGNDDDAAGEPQG